MITKKIQATPDIIVVGGGAAGMMAAGRAAERGAKVILVEKKVDPDGKVFPADHRAESVLAVLRQYIDDHQVRILHNTVATNIIFQSGESLRAGGVRCADPGVLDAGKVIVAGGGMSYPKTGPSADGQKRA